MEQRGRPGTRQRLAAALVPCAIALAWYAFTTRSAAEPPAAAPASAPAPAFTEVASHTPSATETFEGLDPVPSSGERRRDGIAGAPVSEFLDCLIQPSELVDIGSPVIGLIDSIHVQRADTIRRGDVLVELESATERAAVELARARAEMDGAERARLANVKLGTHKEVRAKRLFDSNALSLDLREESETAAELARLELQQAREDRRLASLQLAQAEEILRRRTIRSPVDGVVVDRLMQPGERVDEEVILRVAQIDPLLVEVTLPSAMFGKVKPGAKASVEPELGGDQVYFASVKTVDKVIDAASGTFDVHLELPNPDQTLPSGQHCRTRFLEP
jgi:RND family efflux transporter MFP subunit